MKIRIDFVTNSSSTSFCVFGVSLSDVGLEEPKDWDVGRELCESIRAKGIDIHFYGEESMCDAVIGLNLEKMQENETLAEFKNRVKDSLKKVFPEYRIDYSDIKIEVGDFNNHL